MRSRIGLSDRLEYLALVLFVGGLGRLPAGLARLIGRGLGTLAYLVLGSRRRVALDNIRRVFGTELSEAEGRRLARRSFESLGLLLVDFARMRGLTLDRVRGFVATEGEEQDVSLIRGDRGVLFFTAHFGSWELIPYAAALAGFDVAVIARAADNPLIEDYVRQAREGSGAQVITKAGAARVAARLLNEGGCVGILIDQSVPPNRGVPGTWLGLETYTTDAVARLARQTGAIVAPALIVRQAGGRHLLKLGPVVDMIRSDNERHDAMVNTQRCVDAMEQVVLDHPEQWLWCHRRWRQWIDSAGGQSNVSATNGHRSSR